MHSVEGHLKVSLGSGENDEVTGVTEGVRRSEGNSNGRAKSDSKTVNQQIEKKGRKNSASRNARVDLGCRDRATKTYLGQGTTGEIGEEVPETTRDTEVKETDKSGFDPAGVESLLDVNERDKGVLMTAEAQGIHKAEGHGVGPSGNRPGKG